MGVLDTLLRAFRPLRLEDPVFGSLRFYRSGGYWEGKGWFRPVGHEVEWYVTAGPAGPTEREREFLQTLESRFPEVMQQIQPELSEAIWGEPAESATDLPEMLRALSLPDLDESPLDWELVFQDPDGRLYSAVMKDWSLDTVEDHN